MTDYFIEHPEALLRQPKATIADYVKQHGILVPRRFATLAQAKASGLEIIARSEHRQDYNGASGVLESPNLEYYPDITSEDELKGKIFVKSIKRGHVGSYCRLLDTDLNQFKQEVSFSFWEFLTGLNRSVIADSSIPDRYHVMTNSPDGKVCNYTIFENGKIEKEFCNPLTGELKESLGKLIETYESVRNLPRFDKNHCPIMEFQTVGDKDYFLQYHRTRDFEAAGFVLDRSPKKGEVKVPFVRGATSPEGMKCKVTVYYFDPKREWHFDTGNEDGSYDAHYNYSFSELQARKRKVQLKNDDVCLDMSLLKVIAEHTQKSKIFKPQVSIIHNIEDILRKGETTDDFLEQARSTGKNSCMNLYIISDGRKAYIKRLKE
ncbi:MAG: hypothetical protein PHC66_03110 [Candidatus Nanoarchaeia archaeon]|nr:hypothetical protein [Candidatus Nanoarchaeia archaeon]MDD5239424.1 hypothetical protein [Candidatus Nanoarchaeia archaeon]